MSSEAKCIPGEDKISVN